MKKISRALALLFGLLFLISLSFSARTIVSLTRTFSTAGGEAEVRRNHVGVFLPATESLFFQRIGVGARDAARESDIALSFHPVGPEVPEFVMARYSGIDGAIIYPGIDEAEMRRTLDRLDRAGIPVVLIEHGVTEDLPWSFVGTNNFDVGRRIGELAASVTGNTPANNGGSGAAPISMTVVYSEKSPGLDAEKELVELGINAYLGRRLATPVTRRRTGLNPLDAENLTYQLLRTEPDTTVLVFTDTNDTLAAIQVVIDLNLVGRVQIIGFGITEAIREYLERGVLAGTIVVNPHRVGYEAVRVMAGVLRDGYSPGYVDTGVDVIRGRP